MRAVPKLLVAGGYGVVGQQIAQLAVAAGTVSVRIGGRSLAKAQAAATALGCEAAAIDLGDVASWDAALDGVDIVATCIDQHGTAFAACLLARGIHYVDITASDDFLRAIEGLAPLCRAAGATAVLSVGFAPGLTNLLTHSCAARLDQAEHARVAILLGLGDTHGEAAIAWVLRKMFAADAAQRVTARMPFGHDGRLHTAHAFDFADQHIVRRTLGLRQAHSYMAFDSAPLTALSFWLARRLAGRALPWGSLARLMARFRIGSDRCALSIAVSGHRDGRPATVTARCEGRREATLTARVAALVIEHLATGNPPPGVHHIEQLMDANHVYAMLASGGDPFHVVFPA